MKDRVALAAVVIGFLALFGFLVFQAGVACRSHSFPIGLAQDGRADNQAKQTRSILWDWISRDASGFFTAWLVVVGIGQAGLFLWQLRYMRRNMEDAKRAGDAAKVGSEAARENADTARLSMVAGQRAYVFHAGMRWISHRNIHDGSVFWSLRPQWINSGNTPTRGLRVYVQYELRDTPLPEDFGFVPGTPIEVHAVIAPNGVIQSAHYHVKGADLIAIRDKHKFLYVWGIAEYRDVFPETAVRVTKFCVYADNVTGDPCQCWDQESNNVEIFFAIHLQHNCSDDECHP